MEEDEKCFMCFEYDINTEVICTFYPCNHWICYKCFQLFKDQIKNCPYCRTNLNENIGFFGIHKIYMQTLSNNMIKIKVNLNKTTINQILHRFQYLWGGGEYRIIYQGKQVSCDYYNEKKLSDLNITEDSKLLLMLKLRGD